MRLNSVMKTYPKSDRSEEDLPWNVLRAFEDFVTQELVMLFTALRVNGKCSYLLKCFAKM